MIDLTNTSLDLAGVLQSVQSPDAGASVLFVGTTRRWTAGRETLWLDYEGYVEMARRELEELEAEARRRWPLVGCAVVHRLGRVEVGEPSVAIAVSSGHRDAAFEAGKWLIDRIKEVVPIWKQEHWADGTAAWVHPSGTAAAPEERT